MGELALEHVCDDLHVAVAVRAESASGLHAILVDHPQRAKSQKVGIVVIGEREGVIRVQPAVIEMAALFGSANVNHRAMCNICPSPGTFMSFRRTTWVFSIFSLRPKSR